MSVGETHEPGAAARLLALFRDARLDGAEPDFARSAALLRAAARDPVEINALLSEAGRSNDGAAILRVLRRHARAAGDAMGREIDRLSDRDAAVLFWGQSIGATSAVGALAGVATGAVATGGALALIGAGAALFGYATRERVSAAQEKDRLRHGRDSVAQLAEEMEAQAAALEARAVGPGPGA